MLIKTLSELTIPEEKGAIFVHPEYASWVSSMYENKSAVKNLSLLAESPRELLSIALDHSYITSVPKCFEDKCENIIATGHQAVWHHCGILAKNCIINKFARQVGGCSVHLVLDHDICDTAMVLPKSDKDGNWCFRRIEIEDKQKPTPLEFRSPPTTEKIKTFIVAVLEADKSRFCSKIWPEYVKSKSALSSNFRNIADFITCFQAMLNSALGINMTYLSVAHLSESNCFVGFVTSIIARALDFAHSYNGAIFEQVKKRKINRSETIRPLKVESSEGAVELPFWLVSPKGRRTSLYVRPNHSNKIIIGTVSTVLGNLQSTGNSENSEQLRNILSQHGYRLRPKAVPLTLFVRLFLANWFVHGIGGGLYESITDRIIKDYYGIKKLSFGVATATLMLPLLDCTDSRSKTALQLRQQLRDVKYNPEKFIKSSLLQKKTVKSIINKKRDLIDIARARNQSADARRLAWLSIAEVNNHLLKYVEQSPQDIERKIKSSKRYELSRGVLNHREFFFGLFPEELLRSMSCADD